MKTVTVNRKKWNFGNKAKASLVNNGCVISLLKL